MASWAVQEAREKIHVTLSLDAPIGLQFHSHSKAELPLRVPRLPQATSDSADRSSPRRIMAMDCNVSPYGATWCHVLQRCPTLQPKLTCQSILSSVNIVVCVDFELGLYECHRLHRL